MKYTRIAVTTTGSGGGAVGSTTSEHTLEGKLYAVYLDYAATAPGTTDVTIAQTAGPTLTLLTITDSATDGWYFPRAQVCGNTGTGLTYDGTRTVNIAPYPLCGRLTVAVAGSNALTNCVVAHVFYED